MNKEFNIFDHCKTCEQPFSFGRVYFEPTECSTCNPPIKKPVVIDTTVTTDDVRNSYRNGECEFTADPPEAHEANFDYWLTQHDAEVAKATEERIIKLLKARASDLLGHDGAECDCKVQGEECLAIVNLIKGENK